MANIINSANEVHKTLTPVYNVDYEKELYTSLISEFYMLGTDDLEVEKFLTELYNQSTEHNVSLGEIIKIMEDMYSHEINPNSGVNGIEKIVTKNYDKVLALQVCRELKLHLTPFDTHHNFQIEIKDNVYVLMNFEQREVAVRTIKFNAKGQDTTDYSRVLTCYPMEMIIHNNPISNEGRKFTIKWITKYNESFTTDSMLIPEIETYLENHGYVLSNKHLKGLVSALIELGLENEMVDVRNEIETSGFYYNEVTKSLDVIGYEQEKITIEGLTQSLKLISEIAGFMKGNEVKLATSLKHGLVSPFGFAKKQLGLPLEYLIPYMFHFGRGGSGKTTMARIPLYFYDEPNSQTNDIGGSEFDTVPRFGERVSKFTFSLIINEPAILFKKRSIKEALKSSVERVNARGRFEGKTYVNILALSTITFTSNHPLPIEEGTTRRYVQLLYSFDERKTDKEKKEFMDYFNMNSKTDCRFHELKMLGQFALKCIQSDINLLQLDWQELSNSILKRAYDLCNITCPEWLLDFENVSLESIDEEKTEDIRSFFLSEINQEMGKISYTLYNDGTGQMDFTDDVKEADEFYNQVFDVINNHKLPYMYLRHLRDGRDFVCFTSNLKTVLNKNDFECVSVKSLSEQLEWEYLPTRIDGKVKNVMRIEFSDFLHFLYGVDEE